VEGHGQPEAGRRRGQPGRELLEREAAAIIRAKEDIMTTVLLISWVLLIFVSYKTSVILLKKAGLF
jgi:hypothetical protein